MPKIEGQFTGSQPPIGDDNFISGSATLPGLNQLVENSNEAVDYLDFFVGSSLDEPSISISSDGADITLSLEKAGGGDIRYRKTGETAVLNCTPPVEITLVPGTDSSPITNFVYIDHDTGALVSNTTGFLSTPHSSLGEFFIRSAAFHVANGVLGKNHKNHVFTPGDNGHMEHLNESRRKQPCVFENGLLLTETGSGTGIVNFAVSTGQLYRVHLHDVSGLASPANFFVSNHETIPDDVQVNLHNIATYADGASNLNEYCIYILFIAHLGTTTGLFLLKPSGGYNTESAAYTDPDQTAQWNIPKAYIGASSYVGRVIVRRTASATTVYQINTDIRSLLPGSVAGGGLSGVPDHGASHLSSDPIPVSNASMLGAAESGPVTELTPGEVRELLHLRIDIADIISPVIDIGGASVQKCALTGAQAFATANRSSEIQQIREIHLAPVGAAMTPTWPAWKWSGLAPVTVPDGEVGLLVLDCSGSAETDVIAAYDLLGDGT